MRSFIFTRRNLLLGFSALGGLSAIPISSANQVPKLPRPSSEPVMGDWKGFKYDEKEFGLLR